MTAPAATNQLTTGIWALEGDGTLKGVTKPISSPGTSAVSAPVPDKVKSPWRGVEAGRMGPLGAAEGTFALNAGRIIVA